MKSALLFEAADFFKIDEALILRRINGEGIIKKDWFGERRETKEQIEGFYENESFFFADVLKAKINGMGFLGLRKLIGALELALKLKQNIGTKYLDYGCGIGVTPLLFAKHGFNVSIADISDLMVSFASYRLRNRNIKFSAFNLKCEELPANTFSFVTCFDVLEYAYNPIEVVKNIKKSLKSGGVVFIYFAYGLNEDNPTHLAKDGALIDDIRRMGFKELVKERNQIMRDTEHFFVFENV